MHFPVSIDSRGDLILIPHIRGNIKLLRYPLGHKDRKEPKNLVLPWPQADLACLQKLAYSRPPVVASPELPRWETQDVVELWPSWCFVWGLVHQASCKNAHKSLLCDSGMGESKNWWLVSQVPKLSPRVSFLWFHPKARIKWIFVEKMKAMRF